MLRHVLEFKQVIRFGVYVTNFVGPFDTIQQAEEWYNDLKALAKGPVPDVVCHSMITPN